MYLFPGAEIFKIAMTIEQNGERFYHHSLALAADEPTRAFYRHLIEEEARHYKTFSEMAATGKDLPTPDGVTEEYGKYLKAFVDKILFPQELPEAAGDHVHDLLSAVRFAIQKELDSIYFYREIKGLIPENFQDDVDGIIEEERRHFMDLILMEKSLR